MLRGTDAITDASQERKTMMRALFVLFVFGAGVSAWTSSTGNRRSSTALSAVSSKSAWFSAATQESTSLSQLKAQILQLGAALDRGQSYNPVRFLTS